jgi:hypothetical protein
MKKMKEAKVKLNLSSFSLLFVGLWFAKKNLVFTIIIS